MRNYPGVLVVLALLVGLVGCKQVQLGGAVENTNVEIEGLPRLRVSLDAGSILLGPRLAANSKLAGVAHKPEKPAQPGDGGGQQDTGLGH